MKNFVFFSLAIMSLVSCKKNCDDNNNGSGSGKDSTTCTPNLTKGLLAYYPFNGNFKDSSGNGNNATAMNGAFLTTDFLGRTNSAAGFDGIDDYLIAPRTSKLNSDSFSISVQVMVNSSNRREAILSRTNIDDASGTVFGLGVSQPTDNRWGFAVTSPNQDCSVIHTNDTTIGVHSNPPIQPGRWYNITCTFGGGIQKIYVDGVLQETNTQSFKTAKKCANADLIIGGWWKGDIVSHDGKIDEVRLYNRVLTDCEIAELAETFTN